MIIYIYDYIYTSHSTSRNLGFTLIDTDSQDLYT